MVSVGCLLSLLCYVYRIASLKWYYWFYMKSHDCCLKFFAFILGHEMAISESPRWIEYHVRPENMPWSCNGLGNKNKHGYHIKLEYENIWARFVSAQYCDLRANMLDLMKCAKTKEHIYIIRCFHIRSKEIQTYSGTFWAWYYREKQFIWWVHATTYGMVISYVMFDVSQFSQSYHIHFYYNIHTFIRFQVLSCNDFYMSWVPSREH